MARTEPLFLCIAGGLLVMLTAPAQAQEEPNKLPEASPYINESALESRWREDAPLPPPTAALPFMSSTGIKAWRPVDQSRLLIQNSVDRWFEVTLAAPCPRLPFATSAGFFLEPGGALDRVSGIVVDGQRCYFASVAPVTDRAVPEGDMPPVAGGRP